MNALLLTDDSIASQSESNGTKVHHRPNNLLSLNGLVGTIEAVKNTLFCGDNLEVLRRYIARETVDLVYLDPPFKSDQNYNLLFRDKSGAKSTSQILAFEDTWEWGDEADKSIVALLERGGKLAEVISLFKAYLGNSDMLAYIAMMAPRLVELHRVLKPTGSLYLHCDPTASHYLKLLLDSIFGPENFRNEIVWKRKAGRGETTNKAIRFGVSTDTILFYAKSDKAIFNRQCRPNNPNYLATKFTHDDGDGRFYQLDNLTSPSPRPNLTYEYKGHLPPANGWAVSRQRMEEMEAAGLLYIPADKTKRIRRKRYLDKLEGETVDSLWDDIAPINSQAKERLGYPTQKPQALLERIIEASSNPGDVVLDPFCGCGTTIEASDKKLRSWLGIDVTVQAMRVIRNERLGKLNYTAPKNYRMVYHPADLNAAEEFAAEQPLAFQDWVVEMLNGVPSRMHSGDGGIDGRMYFQEDPDAPIRQIIVSVKGGKLKAPFVRELQGAVARERASMGILVTLHEPSKQMRRSIAAGIYSCSLGTFPKTQFITVGEILSHVALNLPPIKRPDNVSKFPVRAAIDQLRLFDVG